MRSGIWAAALFCIVFTIDSLCPITTSFDSRWTIPVALSLIERGDTNLDEYHDLIEHDEHYAVDCVQVDGSLSTGNCNGHYYNWYPVAVPVMAVPVVFGLRKTVLLFSPLLAHFVNTSIPVVSAFLTGDFVTSRALVEMIAASFFVALTAVVIFFIGSLFLPHAWATALALIFAFATSAWSTASRALWQHGPSMLMLSLAMYLLLTAESQPWRAALAAVPVSVAYLLRPNNAVIGAAFTLYVATRYRPVRYRPVRYRRYLIGYLLCAAPVGAVFLIFNESIYHRALPTYFLRRPPQFPHNMGPFLQAAIGALISPSRGLLIYTPIFLFSMWGMIWALRTGWRRPLPAYLIGIVVGCWLLQAVYFKTWWGGHSYGPRLFSDVTPVFIFFLIPALLKWRESMKWPAAAVFVILLGVSGFIHSRGARSPDVYKWNVEPVNVDQNPARLWDWSDPQFLRGLRRLK